MLINASIQHVKLISVLLSLVDDWTYILAHCCIWIRRLWVTVNLSEMSVSTVVGGLGSMACGCQSKMVKWCFVLHLVGMKIFEETCCRYVATVYEKVAQMASLIWDDKRGPFFIFCIDWLVGWLVSWLAGCQWLAGWLIDWLIDWMIDWLI